jgi:hypothetical protein
VPTKPITTGEGGMIVTDALAAQHPLVRNFGDAGKFQWDLLGFNYRLNAMAAGIGICQFAKFRQIIAMRRDNEAVADEDPVVRPWTHSIDDINYQLYTICFRLDLLDVIRDQIIDEWADLGVASKLYDPAWHRRGVCQVGSPVGPGLSLLDPTRAIGPIDPDSYRAGARKSGLRQHDVVKGRAGPAETGPAVTVRPRLLRAAGPGHARSA